MDEITQQQVCNYLSNYIENIDCESITSVLQQCASIPDVSDEDFINCVVDNLSEENIIEEDDECQQALNSYISNFNIDFSSLSRSQQLGLNSLTLSGDCSNSDEFAEKACSILISKEIEELKDNVFFPCLDQTNEELLNEAASNACPAESGKNPLENLYNQIGIKKGIISTDFENDTKEECPLLYCAYQALKEHTISVGNDQENLWCTTLGNFESGQNDVTLILSYINNGFDNNALGGTSPDQYMDKPEYPYPNGAINMGISVDLCNKDPLDALQMAGVILHEGVHAQFLNYVFESVEGVPPQSEFSIFSETWCAILKKRYGYTDEVDCTDTSPANEVIINHHTVMAFEYVESIAKSLHELNGGFGNWEDYQYLAWEGIGIDLAISLGAISQSEINSLKNTYYSKIRDNVQFDTSCL